MLNADVQMRRVTVESIIGLAANSTGNYQLVNIEEGADSTTMDFDLFHPYRGVNGDSVERVHIDIRTL